MATIEWKDIPADILSDIAKLLNSDVDILRLRSVCSPWRSSLPLPHKPFRRSSVPLPHKQFSFPLKLPPLITNLSDLPFWSRETAEIELKGGHFVLDEVTLYLLSPPTDDDLSSGWLLRATSHMNSNTSTMRKMENPISKQVNLRDYRISEVCKYHTINFTHKRVPKVCKSYPVNFLDNRVPETWIDNDDRLIMMSGYKKVLFNYFPDCEFAALVLNSNGTMRYWKLGDEDWTLIDALLIDDVILYQGKCYAVYNGVLARFDSEWNWTIAAKSPIFDHHNYVQTYLVEFDSDLYVVWCYGYDAEQFGDELYHKFPSRLSLARFNECDGSLDSVEDLTDAFFILSKYASHGFHAKDFAGFKGNRVYMYDC